MHFGEIEEQGEIVRSIEKLVEQHLPMHSQRQRDAESDPPYALLRVLGDAGLLALPFNESGAGQVQASPANWQTVALVQYTFGRHAWMLGSLYNRAIGFGGMSVATYGSEAQREILLPQITRGELLFALALTENGAGSDASAISCKATQADGGFILNGSKAWVSDAKQADYIIVAARTSGSPGSNAGISLFLLPRSSEGVQMTLLGKVGNHCLPTYDVHFDNTFVDETSMMGERDRGFSHLMSTLHFARAGMAASVSGYAQFAVDIAIEHAKTRVQFGRSIGNFQVIAHRIADMQMRVDQSVLLARELAYRIANGLDCRRQAAQAKVVATETLQFVTQHGMQILASNGYDDASDMARIWRDSRLYSFGEGSNEIQRNIIAKELGLNQEPTR